MFETVKEKLGNNKEDIKRVIFLMGDDSKIDYTYIEYNDGRVIKERRNIGDNYQEFLKNISLLLRNVGANANDKGKTWFVTTKKNGWGIDFDKLDTISEPKKNINKANIEIRKYINNKSVESNADFVSSEKRFSLLRVERIEELEQLEDDYFKYKAKFVRDLILSAGFALFAYNFMKIDGSYAMLHPSVIYSIEALLIFCSLTDLLGMSVNKKLKKRIENSVIR